MMLPLHLLTHNGYNNPVAFSTDIGYISTLRLLLRLYPEAAGMKDVSGLTPYSFTEFDENPLFCRLLLRSAPDQDPAILHHLNWKERKMAMFLGLTAVSASPETMIFAKIRFENNDLFCSVVSFL